jgi:hypothetical protein
VALSNRMSLRPGLLWLTLNLALIISVYHEIFYSSVLHKPYYVFAYSVRCISLSLSLFPPFTLDVDYTRRLCITSITHQQRSRYKVEGKLHPGVKAIPVTGRGGL